MVLERVLYERFPFNKNSSLKVWKFQTVHVMVHLVHFGYCSCKQDTKERNNFVIILWKGTFRSDRPKWLDRSKWTTFTTEATTYFCPQGGNCGALSLKMAGKLSTPPPFLSRGYLKDCGKLTKWNIHSKMGCHYLWPCWFACVAMDYWLKQHNMGWQYLKQVRCKKGEKKWNNKHGEML